MMTIEEILFSFKECEENSLRKALKMALHHQEALTPHLLPILEKAIAQPEEVLLSQWDHLLALYLLSKFRETKAFPLVMALAELPEETPENLLRDGITEGLSRFMVSTFNGDLKRIKHLIENSDANPWCRAAGLRSLLGLIAINQLTREEVVDYLRTLFHSPLAEDEDFVTQLVNVSSDLYPEELFPEINQAFEADKVDWTLTDIELVEEILAQGKEACLLEHVYRDYAHLPVDDVEEAIRWMEIFDEHIRRNSVNQHHAKVSDMM